MHFYSILALHSFTLHLGDFSFCGLFCRLYTSSHMNSQIFQLLINVSHLFMCFIIILRTICIAILINCLLSNYFQFPLERLLVFILSSSNSLLALLIFPHLHPKLTFFLSLIFYFSHGLLPAVSCP
jgi:hypothetical protein